MSTSIRHGRLPTANVAAGAVLLHPQGANSANYARQMQMHQMAKEESLRQYYTKLENSINEAGVRDQDLEGWNKKVADWQQYAVQNRNALANPNADGGKAQMQFSSMHRDLMGDIQKSKAAAAFQRQIAPLFSNPKVSVMASDYDHKIADRSGRSIYDPLHYKDDGTTPFSASDLSFNAPAYDINRQRATNIELTRGLKQEKTYGKGQVNTQELKDYVPFTLKHSKENLRTIGDRAAALYGDGEHGDKSFQQYYDTMPIDAQTHEKLDQLYKSVYPEDAEGIGADHKKLAIAHSLQLNSQETHGTEIKGWSRPPQPRAVPKGQEAQQNMLQWVNGMTTAVKNGDENEMNRYGDLLYAGKGTSKYQGLEKGLIQTGNPKGMSLPENIKPGVSIIHEDQQYNPTKGIYEPTTNRDFLDPNDPALSDKLGRIYQMHMGSTPALKSALTKQTVQSAPPTAKPVVAPTTDDSGTGSLKLKLPGAGQ
jgi:hypothetical protein